MNLVNILFIAFSLITVLCAIMVVFSKNPIYSILYLILTMFSLSGHYLILQAQFIGVVNIIVYAGAIMVLFLFVLMLLNLKKDNEPNKSLLWKFLGTGMGILGFALVFLIGKVELSGNSSLTQVPVGSDFGYVKPLGSLLFRNYVFPFEIASILFLAAMVGVVFIGGKKNANI